MGYFKNKRYITCGIDANIPLILQAAMWGMIGEDTAAGLKMDYLQVFTLKPVTKSGKEYQEIKLLQEQPKRERLISVDLSITPISAKIFVIDSGEYTTMMLNNEY